MALDSGLAISAEGQVARACRGDERCEWGIAFDRVDADDLARHRIFETVDMLERQPDCVVLVSSHPLELVWWFARLPPEQRRVFVGTSDPLVLERLRAMDPARDVRPLE
jgi:hypothetical protein